MATAITATYVDATTFTVSGDKTSEFVADRRVKMADSLGALHYGAIDADSTYSGGTGLTTVILTSGSDDVPSDLGGVFFGIVSSGATGSLPIHAHSGEDQGGLIVHDAVKLQGITISTDTPTDGEVLTYSAANNHLEYGAFNSGIKEGRTQLDDGSTTASILFDAAYTDDLTYKVKWDLENTVDGTSSIYDGIITTKSGGGFTVTFNGAIDSANYYLNWMTTQSGSLSGGITDHGNLDGLSDDDHTHYLNTTRHDTTDRHGSSVVDHGLIGGLADDDHSQYHNDTRGDARYLWVENVTEFTPTADYHPATKKYCDDEVSTLNIVNDVTPQLGGDLDLNDFNLLVTSALASDHTTCGLIAKMTIDSNSAGFGGALRLDSNGEWTNSDADSDSTMPCRALAIDTDTGANKRVLLWGFIRDDTWNWTPGGVVYASTTLGAMTQSMPAGSADIVQVVGYAITADILHFTPCDSTIAEVA